jgi:hypothetical protein
MLSCSFGSSMFVEHRAKEDCWVAFVLKIGDENWRRMVLESSEAVKDNPRACLQDGLPPFIKSPDEWAWNGLGLEAP